MVNKILGHLQKSLLEMKYLGRLIPFLTHGERRRLSVWNPLPILRVVGKRKLYSLTLNIGSIYMFDTNWMSCILRKMFAKALLEHCLIF